MKLHIKVDLGDGPVVVTTNLQAVVAWERRFKTKIGALAEGLGLEDLMFLAFESCKAAQIVVPVEFESFIRKVTDIEVVAEDVSRPFPSAPTGGS